MSTAIKSLPAAQTLIKRLTKMWEKKCIKRWCLMNKSQKRVKMIS